MPRRPVTKASRGAVASALLQPSPGISNQTTPLSSAYQSTYNTEWEGDAEDDVSETPISSLSFQDGHESGENVTQVKKKKKKKRLKPFNFLGLPSELRDQIYGHFFADTPQVLDLDPDNYKRIHKKLGLLRTCRTIYHEATYIFYSTHTFRVFPTHPGRFFKTKKPLLARLSPRQRSFITSLELRLGPGWNKPPRGWVVNPALGLADCVKTRQLTVFVECDPSDGVFNGFRRADDFYECFSRHLLTDLLAEMPFLRDITFDAWSSVKKSGGMMRGLLDVAASQGRNIHWGPERGWTDKDGDPEDEHPVKAVTGHAVTATALLNGVGLNVVVIG